MSMNRRDLLLYAASGSGLVLTDKVLAAPCPPSPVSVSGGTSVSTPCVSGTGAAADWAARSGAAGVVQAIRFATAANVTNYRHGDAMASRVVHDPTDGIIGDGCLKINVLRADGANSGNWRAPLNSAWTTDGQGFGSTELYVQYRVKLGPNRLTASNGGGGFKICNIAGYKPSCPGCSHSHTGHEIVVGNAYWRGSLLAYREHPVSGTTSFETTNSAGDIFLQTGLDRGAHITDKYQRYCLYQGGPGSAGCWDFEEQAWFTIYYRIKIVDYGGAGTGNAIDIYVARAGETAYTLLYNNRNFRIGSDSDYAQGVNGIWFLPYDTNRSSANYDTWHKYDQLIVSTQPIACPV
jgi:hypothetical protein